MSFDVINGDLKKYRENAGLQEVELANKLNITTKTLIAIEKKLPGAVESMDLLLKLKWRVRCEKSVFQYFKLAILHALDKKH